MIAGRFHHSQGFVSAGRCISKHGEFDKAEPPSGATRGLPFFKRPFKKIGIGSCGVIVRSVVWLRQHTPKHGKQEDERDKSQESEHESDGGGLCFDYRPGAEHTARKRNQIYHQYRDHVHHSIECVHDLTVRY